MNIYTGDQSILDYGRTLTPTLQPLLDLIDAAATAHGVTYKSKNLTAARSAAHKAAELGPALTERTTDHEARVRTVAAFYAAGKVEADAVIAEVLEVTTDEHLKKVDVLIRVARVVIEQAGLSALRQITEDEWIDPLRPVVADLIEQADAAAADVGITGPRIDPAGVRSARHPWTPSEHDLTVTATRHAWERLQEVLTKLSEVQGVADNLRMFGLIPTAPGRATREDYRWLDLRHLDGDPSQVREFWLANRDAATPGVFTSDELQAQAPNRAQHQLGHDMYAKPVGATL